LGAKILTRGNKQKSGKMYVKRLVPKIRRAPSPYLTREKLFKKEKTLVAVMWGGKKIAKSLPKAAKLEGRENDLKDRVIAEEIRVWTRQRSPKKIPSGKKPSRRRAPLQKSRRGKKGKRK